MVEKSAFFFVWCVLRMAHFARRIRGLCRRLLNQTDHEQAELVQVASKALDAVRSKVEARTVDIIQGMNGSLWTKDRHVLLFVLTSEAAIGRALRDVPALFLLPLEYIEDQYRDFQPHLTLVRAILASKQHAPYMIVLELPKLRPTKFADTFVVSGTFLLPMSWNRQGRQLNAQKLAHDIALAGGTSISVAMDAPSEPAVTATDEEIALGQDPDVILAAFTATECAHCETMTRKLRKCAGCLVARYCCADHQAAHWPAHKLQCRKLADWHRLRSVQV